MNPYLTLFRPDSSSIVGLLYLKTEQSSARHRALAIAANSAPTLAGCSSYRDVLFLTEDQSAQSLLRVSGGASRATLPCPALKTRHFARCITMGKSKWADRRFAKFSSFKSKLLSGDGYGAS